MNHRLGLLTLVALTASLISGCNSARAPQTVARAEPAAAAPNAANLPENAGCSGAIARYRAIMDNDLSMGHVNRGVYDRIQTEIGEAAAACSQGQDARAAALVKASKARHGYPG
jgi:hypothetical protein